MLEDPNEAGNEELATERRPNAKDRNMSEWISRKSPTGEKYAPKTEPSQTANRQQASVAQPDRLNVARLASPTAVFLSAHEFAARSGLSLSTIRRYLKNGRLPGVQPGGSRCRVLIPSDALDSLCDPAGRSKTLTSKASDSNTVNNPTLPPSASLQSALSGPVPRWLGKK